LITAEDLTMIWSQPVRDFLNLHDIGWVTGEEGVGTYAALQDVCRPLGGFPRYLETWSDKARTRGRLQRLEGTERWVEGELLRQFLDVTGRPAAMSLLIANEDRIRSLLELHRWPGVAAPLQLEAVQAQKSHDEMKDELALLCTYAGIPVHNEVPLKVQHARVKSRRPDLCLWLGQDIWVVDVKTTIDRGVILEMAERQYDEVIRLHHGRLPARMMLVSEITYPQGVHDLAHEHGYEVWEFQHLKKTLLGRVQRLHRHSTPQYDKIQEMFSPAPAR
jgi:hypothetical protein